ncbi:DUF3943 domain-containing protein [Ramlibacter sp.]|uniref:DUF3943 domain-containing protein n=1 Tax=Ramlibacter sp. TaxID=1917967 RepID=UPI0026097B37|nr:DUF3943 domain-containing protein [Ramlibacter sp.]MDB5958215.1 hypothetical protein [Ramlibacter sp.]
MPHQPSRLRSAAWLLLLATSFACAQEQAAPAAAATPAAAAPAAAADPSSLPHWRDPLLPALEILEFELLLNRINRCCGNGRGDYAVNWSTIRHNLHSGWVVDNDPFSVNQFAHPYSGSMYYGFARSNGFDFWTSTAYALGGSALWEIAGERTPPSRNDLISTGIGGSLLGEPLFRMANLLLEHGGGMTPFWRETVAAAVSPSTAFNRWLQGRGPDTVFSSHGAPYYSRLSLGVMGTSQNQAGNSTASVQRAEAQAEFALDYGMPGQEGYEYRRPFDYFTFQATASSANGFENVMTRGLLLGRDYRAGSDYRGVWGLYGSYDYLSPQTFRVSSTAVSLGTTGQWGRGDWVVTGTGTAGLGYAAVGTLSSAAPGVDRDYHYGVAPQVLLAARVIHGGKWALDLTARDFFVSNIGDSTRGGHDNIARAELAWTWRLHDQQAITVKYLWNRRNAQYPDLGDRSQTRGTIGVFYTLLGHDRFGALDWK